MTPQEWQEWQSDLDASDATLVVEGPRDEAALRSLGLNNAIVCLHGRAIFQVIEKIPKGSKVVILVDLDGHGRQLYGKLKSHLERRGVYVDRKFREALAREHLSHIEGLNTRILNASREKIPNI